MEGGGDGGRGGTAGVMYPRNQAAAWLEEMEAKLGVLGPWLSLLLQVGCWPLSLSSWVSNCTATPVVSVSLTLTGCCWGGESRYLDAESFGHLIKQSPLWKSFVYVCATLKSLRGLNNKCHNCTRRLIFKIQYSPPQKKEILWRGKYFTQQNRT